MSLLSEKKKGTIIAFFMHNIMEPIDANLLCTVSAINVRMDELVEREKGKHAYCIFRAKHARTYRFQKLHEQKRWLRHISHPK